MNKAYYFAIDLEASDHLKYKILRKIFNTFKPINYNKFYAHLIIECSFKECSRLSFLSQDFAINPSMQIFFKYLPFKGVRNENHRLIYLRKHFYYLL